MSEREARRRAGELEAEILGVLWSSEESLGAADVLERLGGDVVYTTVAKVLDRLAAKGKVSRVRAGRAYRYLPVDAESSWIAGQVQGLLDRAGNRSAVLQGFVDGLSTEDSAQLAALLEVAQRRRTGPRSDARK